MDDSWSPSPASAGMYWSVEECRWLASPPVEVALPQQRVDQPVEEPLPAGP